MGRVKKNRPRRERRVTPAECWLSLYEMSPGGWHYTDWIDTDGTDLAGWAAAADKLSQDSPLARSIEFYQRVYGRWVPALAVGVLDQIAEGDWLPLRQASGVVESLPLDEFFAKDESEPSTSEDVRTGLHELHAAGMVLLDDEGAVCLTIPPNAGSVVVPGPRGGRERVAPVGPWGQGRSERNVLRLAAPVS